MPEFDSTVEYRDVEGFPGYKVGNDGSVWSSLVRTARKGRRRGFSYALSDNWRKLRLTKGCTQNNISNILTGRIWKHVV